MLARLRAADAAEKDVAAGRKQVEKELARVEDLRRQVLTARHAREAAEAERDEERGRADRGQRALDAAHARAAAAEAKLHERVTALEAADADAAAAASPDERVTALTDELEAVRAHREELLRQGEELHEQSAQDAKTIARLSTLLAEGAGSPQTEVIDGQAAPPGTALEAVERAAEAAVSLRFTPDAFTSAADSPYRRPAEILEALTVLDELATLHADPDGFGRSLTQAATERGLTYKHDVSETARSRHPHEYSTTVDGRAHRPWPARRTSGQAQEPASSPGSTCTSPTAPVRPAWHVRRARRPPPARHDDLSARRHHPDLGAWLSSGGTPTHRRRRGYSVFSAKYVATGLALKFSILA